MVDLINRQVYDFYSRIPDREALATTWLPLLEALLGRGTRQRVEIFTTNYDLVLERAAEMVGGPASDRPISTGRTGGLQTRLDLDQWRPAARATADPRSSRGLVTKLHGSVDWSRVGDAIFVGEPGYKGSEERHVIIYPGYKGAFDREPFTIFDAHFRAAAAEATDLIFVGFAFRDEHINNILRQATNPQAKIVVIDPADVGERMPYSRERVKYLRRGFDKKAAQRCMAVLSTNTDS